MQTLETRGITLSLQNVLASEEVMSETFLVYFLTHPFSFCSLNFLINRRWLTVIQRGFEGVTFAQEDSKIKVKVIWMDFFLITFIFTS